MGGQQDCISPGSELSPDDLAKLKSKKEKKKKASKLRKILKERLNIDCLRMLTEDYSNEQDNNAAGFDDELNDEWAPEQPV
jgi:hypothetical protein